MGQGGNGEWEPPEQMTAPAIDRHFSQHGHSLVEIRRRHRQSLLRMTQAAGMIPTPVMTRPRGVKEMRPLPSVANQRHPLRNSQRGVQPAAR